MIKQYSFDDYWANWVNLPFQYIRMARIVPFTKASYFCIKN